MQKYKTLWKRFWNMQESGVLLATVLFIVIITCVNRVFLTQENISNVLRGTGFTLLTTLGITLVLISGGLDLSVGSVYALGGTVCAKCLVAGVPLWASVFCGLLAGILVGVVNGFIIVKMNIPPLIVTLGMMYIARGVVYVMTQGVPVYPLPDEFKALEQSSVLGGDPQCSGIVIDIGCVNKCFNEADGVGPSDICGRWKRGCGAYFRYQCGPNKNVCLHINRRLGCIDRNFDDVTVRVCPGSGWARL